MANDVIRNLAELKAIYGKPNTNAVTKVSGVLNETYQRWLAQARFFIIASQGEHGIDCTPRGDEAGQAFAIEDETTLLIPDRRGNNRIDTLQNILENPAIALLFCIPGINQTVRITGRATISVDKTRRALLRSGMWEQDEYIQHDQVPSAEELQQSTQSKPPG